MDLMDRRGLMGGVQPTSNLFGGNLFARVAKQVWNRNIIESEDGRYFEHYGTKYTGALSFKNYFDVKENTQYTFLFDLYASVNETQFFVLGYTDGSYTPIYAYNPRKVTRLVTAKNKTISGMWIQGRNVTRRCYFDTSGIFEGVVSADDFEPWRG